MSDTPYRALVVDDEPIARRTVMWALSEEKFECMPAVDGYDALEKVKHAKYDLIVTDLCMPNKHGYALFTELLASGAEYTPIIVAHSSVDEPRLTKDLMIRGADDIVYKPTNYAAFAAKMKGLVIRRRLKHEEVPAEQTDVVNQTTISNESQGVRLPAPLSVKDFDARLDDVPHIFPVSNSSAEVLTLLASSDFDARALASVIGNDAVLTIELLRVANSSQYAWSGRKISDLNEAITRLGTKRVGQIAIEVGAMAGLTKLIVPWFDKDVASRRCLASCASAKRLLNLQGMTDDDNGVFFSAMVYPLTRLVIGSAFANVYETLIAECGRSHKSLRSLERQVFPRTPAEATLQILSNWRLPMEMCRPLSYADTGTDSLATLGEPVRTMAKQLKAAILLGEHIVGKWLPWEEKSELPPRSFFESLKIENVAEFIDSVCGELSESRRC